MTSSSSTEAASNPETILVGTVLAPHGIRGEVQVAVHSDNRERFAPGAVLRATRGPAGGATELRVRRATPHKGGLRISFEGFGDRDAAETLRGVELTVDRSAIPPATPGSYYLFELVGCRCVDEREGELGDVVEVLADGGGWIVEVESRTEAGGRRLSLPFAEEFVVRVDPAARRIDWRLPEGLVEACASRF